MLVRLLNLLPLPFDSFFIPVDLSSNFRSDRLPLQAGKCSAQRAAQSRIAPWSPDLQACWRSLGRGGKGSASDIRISFHCMSGVRSGQAERRFVTFELFEWVGTALSADWMRPSRFLFYTMTALGRITGKS
jgi:hypothetical protein